MPTGFLMSQGIRPNIYIGVGNCSGGWGSDRTATTLETQDQNFLNWYLQLQGGGKEAST